MHSPKALTKLTFVLACTLISDIHMPIPFLVFPCNAHRKKVQPEVDTTASVDKLKKKKKKKKKRDRDSTTSTLDDSIADLQSAQAAADLHAAQEGHAGTTLNTRPTKRPKKTSTRAPRMPAAMRDATQLGQYSYYREQLRDCAHEVAPADPPVMPMFFPGSGPSDAYHYLNNRFPQLLEEHQKSPANEQQFGRPVSHRIQPHPGTHPPSLSTPSPPSSPSIPQLRKLHNNERASQMRQLRQIFFSEKVHFKIHLVMPLPVHLFNVHY